MSTNARQMNCCGAREITDIQLSKHSKDALIAVLKAAVTGCQFAGRKAAPTRMGQFVFTQADQAGASRPKYGEHFAAYLVNQKLGSVSQAAKVAKNPNYDRGHSIKMWIWTPDPKAVWKWWKENGGEDAKQKIQTWW